MPQFCLHCISHAYILNVHTHDGLNTIMNLLQVCLQLLCGRGESCELLSGSQSAVGMDRESERQGERERDGEVATESAASSGKLGGAPPIRVVESQTASAKGECLYLRRLELLISVFCSHRY